MSKAIAGYRILALLYEGNQSRVFRAHDDEAGRPVVLKVLRDAHAPLEETAWFRREFELTRDLDVEGVIGAYGLTSDQHREVMVLEDIGGTSLTQLLADGGLALGDGLRVAARTAGILANVHRAQVIHKDVNPSNLVLNPETGELRLIDFGISSVLSREHTALETANQLQGTLAYISPEQTGRTNRSVDHRSDLYSLGITLYELLTGTRPFESADVLELVHAHLAVEPVPTHLLDPEIPRPVSDIVVKLLAKDPEDRYQSASGLRVDLETCLRELEGAGSVAPFRLGRKDASERFQIPQRLYGRAHEIRTLENAFDRAGRGRAEFVLVAGNGGVGKTALVRELYKPITARRGYFASGKFDQIQRETPYAAITMAVRSLVRQLLTEPDDRVARWRDRLAEALAPSGQVLIDLVPELGAVIGPQPPVPELPPSASVNRLNFAFRNLVEAIASSDHPLVLFLDDLQWADLASLALVRSLMTADLRHLLLIGAYRDNEVDPAHPLISTVDAIERSGVPVDRLVLEPLAVSDLAELVAESLRSSADRAAELAALVEVKTRGNPYFVREFLQSLYLRGLFRYVPARNAWEWDHEEIRAQDMTDNVVDLMTERLMGLDDRTRRLLSRAACIGNPFDLGILAFIQDASPEETASDLWEALSQGLVTPLGREYKLMSLDVEGLSLGITVEYAFAHDRVQEAAYAQVPEGDKHRHHHRIGRLLLAKTPPDELDERLFDVVNHLNAGRELVQSRETRLELADLNLRAGRRAKAAAAHGAAFNLLETGLELLEPDPWSQEYDRTLAMSGEAAEAAYLVGDFETADRLVQAVLERARSSRDKTTAYAVRVQACLTRARFAEAVTAALDALHELGVEFPPSPTADDVDSELAATERVLEPHTPQDLLLHPELTDEGQRAALRLLNMLATVTYGGFPELYALSVARMVRLSVEHGLTAESASAFTSYGVIQASIRGDIPAGYAYGRLSLALVDRLGAESVRPVVLYLFNMFLRHTKEPYRDALEPLLEAHRHAMATGQLAFAATALSGYAAMAHLSGMELPGVEAELARYHRRLVQLNQPYAVPRYQLYRQIGVNLMDEGDRPSELRGPHYDEEQILSAATASRQLGVVGLHHVNKLMLCYRFQAYDAALEHAQAAGEYVAAFSGLPELPLFLFYQALTRLARLEGESEVERVTELDRIQALRERLGALAAHSPANLVHRCSLLDGEIARVSDDHEVAGKAYDEAIDLAQSNGHLGEEGLAGELAAAYFLAQGRRRLASHALRDAYLAYHRWGARAKVRNLEQRYPEFLARGATSSVATLLQSVSGSSAFSTSAAASALDVESMLRASQAISQEIVPDRLFTTLIRIVIENAGADSGSLLLKEDEHWLWVAHGSVQDGQVRVTHASLDNPWEMEPGRIPVSLVNFVERMHESVVLDHVAESRFSNDPYFAAPEARSVMGIPLLKQERLVGLFYLENHLTSGAFTSDRLDVLEVLATQAAISIENTRLFQREVEMKDAAQRFLPPRFLAFLGRDDLTQVTLGDQVQEEMAILVSDIRSFTTLSEKMTPQESLDFVNAYLARVSPILRDHGGLIVKYMGDGILAVFNESVDQAVEAAIATLGAVRGYNDERRSEGRDPMQIGIGLHSGMTMLGTVGEKQRLQLDLLSDSVNLASRLEGLTRRYGASLILSEEAFDRLDDPGGFTARSLGVARVKGRKGAVSLLEILDGEDEDSRRLKQETKEQFEEGLRLYHDGEFAEASVRFTAVSRRNPRDKAAAFYLARAADYMVRGAPPDWEEPTLVEQE